MLQIHLGLDGAAVVQMLNPVAARTFGYSVSSLCLKSATTAMAVDRVWDVYIPDSLKGTTRKKRRKGI